MVATGRLALGFFAGLAMMLAMVRLVCAVQWNDWGAEAWDHDPSGPVTIGSPAHLLLRRHGEAGRAISSCICNAAGKPPPEAVLDKAAVSKSRKRLDSVFGNPEIQSACEDEERRENPLPQVDIGMVIDLWDQLLLSFERQKCHCYNRHTIRSSYDIATKRCNKEAENASRAILRDLDTTPHLHAALGRAEQAAGVTVRGAAPGLPVYTAPPLPRPRPKRQQQQQRFFSLADAADAPLVFRTSLGEPRPRRERPAQRLRNLQRAMVQRASTADDALAAGAWALRDPAALAQRMARAAGKVRGDAAATVDAATDVAKGMPGRFVEGVKGSFMAPPPAANGVPTH